MSFRDGLRAAARSLTAADPGSPARTAGNSALLGPVDIASPWADSSVLQSIVLSDLFGADAAALLPITRAAAIQVPAAARARGLICNTLGRLDLEARARNGSPAGGPAALFLEQPDPAQSRLIQITWTADDLIFHGVSWWLVLARSGGVVTAARRIIPGGVVLEDGGRVTVYGSPTDPADLIRIDGPHEGILTSASSTLRAAAALERSAARFADNPVPAIELHQTDDYPITKPEIVDLVKAWAKARGGADGGIAYTPRNIEARVHGLPAENLLTFGRNTAAVDVARHIGVPADSIDASPERASMTYANVETKARVLVDYGVQAYGDAIVARLSMNDVTPPGVLAVVNYGGITAASDADPATSAPGAQLGNP